MAKIKLKENKKKCWFCGKEATSVFTFLNPKKKPHYHCDECSKLYVKKGVQ